MSLFRSSGSTDMRASIALLLLLLVAPLAGGSSRIEVLPVLVVLALVALGFELACAQKASRSLHVVDLSFGLAALGAICALQTVPLSGSILALLSGHASEVREFVTGDPGGPVSYEPASSWREATKLLLYAVVATVAFNRARSRRGPYVVLGAIIISGLAAALLAVVHRALGADRVLGLVESSIPASQLITTFANPNHSAGFMVLCALIAVGLALEAESRSTRMGFFACAALFAALCVGSLSRGGIGALGVGSLVFIVLIQRGTGAGRTESPRLWSALAVGISVPLLVALLNFDALRREFVGHEGVEIVGVAEKIAAVGDAIPMVADHFWLGIGRGAYSSVYPFYKTSSLQLTFAFPENIIAQLLAEWGMLVGGLALLGLIVVLASRLRAPASPATAGAAAGVAALAVHNFLDFSFELPGVALPVVAVLGAIGPRRTMRVKLRGSRGALLAGVVVTMLAATSLLAWTGGDLRRDLAQLDALVRAREAQLEARVPGTRSLVLEGERLAHRHPVNPLTAAQMSYLYETATPPELRKAMRWANRTLYLAPTYADGHAAAGRLLVRAGHRDQGMAELRVAWGLRTIKEPVLDEVIRLARGPEEILEAVPRRDQAFDIPSELELCRIVTRLNYRKQPVLARRVLESVEIDLAERPVRVVGAIARAALQTRSSTLARQASEVLVARNKTARAYLLLARAARLADDDAGFGQALEQALRLARPEETPAISRMQFAHALEQRQFDVASGALDGLEAALPPTHSGQAEVLAQRARLERAQGHRARATELLGEAIRLEPRDLGLRLSRGELLFELGRTQDAREDVSQVLAVDPKHTRALRLRARLDSGKP